MDEKYLRDRLHHAAETRLSGLAPDPWLTQRVLSSTKGEEKVKKKLSIGFVLVLALVLAAMTALAVGLSSYFGGFAKLEDTYGEFEQWPNSAKVELTQLMINNGVLSEEEATKWTGGLSGPEKELLADEILAAHFADMTYVDTYNAMTRELGPIEKWTDEERVLYTSLLEDYGKLTSSWPTYMLPGDSDLTREEAVARGREAVLTMFSVSAKELDSLVVDAIFSKDSVTLENTPEDEPFWIIEFGYGMAYRAIMTRNGEMLGLMGPQTQYIPWGVSTMGNAQVATPSDHDATREQAIQSSKSSLTEIVNLSYEEVEAMDATAHFFYNDLYCYGDEPVWLVIWSKQGKDQWQVLLGYDASYLDAEPSGKVFDQVVRRHTTLADIWRERCGEIGMTEDFRDANGAYCFDWSLEDKAAFSAAWRPIVAEYLQKNPYAMNTKDVMVQRTRNIHAIPDEKAISQEQALAIGDAALIEKYGDEAIGFDPFIFYIANDPAKPEWRFINVRYWVSVDAYSGEVLTVTDHVEWERTTNKLFGGVDDFIAYVFE